MIKKTIPYLFLLLSSFCALSQEKLTHEVYFETDDYHVLFLFMVFVMIEEVRTTI